VARRRDPYYGANTRRGRLRALQDFDDWGDDLAAEVLRAPRWARPLHTPDPIRSTLHEEYH